MPKQQSKEVSIQKPNFQTVVMTIVGTAPYVQHKFPAKAKQQIIDDQTKGPTAKKDRKKTAKDFDACYKEAMHKSDDGWLGIPAPAFRNALISACKICEFAMTRAKLSVFIEADGFDADDGTPLVKITKGKPECSILPVRIQQTIDMRARPMWKEGWEAVVRIMFDGDQFTVDDIANLMVRVGLQVGIGEGRPDSKTSNGMGWGLFRIANRKELKAS